MQSPLFLRRREQLRRARQRLAARALHNASEVGAEMNHQNHTSRCGSNVWNAPQPPTDCGATGDPRRCRLDVTRSIAAALASVATAGCGASPKAFGAGRETAAGGGKVAEDLEDVGQCQSLEFHDITGVQIDKACRRS